MNTGRIIRILMKVKCDQYWPESGVGNYGDIDVTMVREDVLAFYTLRTFSVVQVRAPQGKKKKVEAAHTVYQYHYTAWPDHGVPLHALPLISFVRNSSAANTDPSTPVLVHCRSVSSLSYPPSPSLLSAGVGRTGCYIVIHAMLHQIISRGDVDVFSFLQHIRTQRNGLV